MGRSQFEKTPGPLGGVISMAIDPTLSRSISATVDWLYAGLIRAGHSNLDTFPNVEQGLGGKLFYAGELDGAGCVSVVAANIAGAASLTASTDTAAHKQAIRNGVIDFLVTSLDEALRILKNELRKGETVAVCVAQEPEDVEREMLELGLLPDLLPPGVLDAPRFEVFLLLGAQQIDPVVADKGQIVLTWSVDAEPNLWLPKLDSIARDCLSLSLPRDSWPGRRWLRRAPRYLGRLAQGVRLLRCETAAAEAFLGLVQEQVANGQLGVSVEISLCSCGRSESHRYSRLGTLSAPKDFSLAGRRPTQSGSIIQ
jgi:urocanate hydratase